MGYTEQAAQVKAKYRHRARAPVPPSPAPPQALYHVTPAHAGAREEEQVVYTASESSHCDLEEEEEVLVAVTDDEDGMSMEDDASHMSHSSAHELPEPVSLVGRALRTHWPAERGRWEVRCVLHAHHLCVLPNVPHLHSCAAQKIWHSNNDRLPRTLLFDMSL